MGLYLCVFENDEELDGVEVGAYSDYNFFIDAVVRELEDGKPGSKYPTLVLHSDSDGAWDAGDCQKLQAELVEIAEKLMALPSVEYQAEWQRNVAKEFSLTNDRLFDSFIDVDGEPLIERILGLVTLARKKNQPVLFQ